MFIHLLICLIGIQFWWLEFVFTDMHWCKILYNNNESVVTVWWSHWIRFGIVFKFISSILTNSPPSLHPSLPPAFPDTILFVAVSQCFLPLTGSAHLPPRGLWACKSSVSSSSVFLPLTVLKVDLFFETLRVLPDEITLDPALNI